jgi:hypothetical protein
VPTWPAFYAAAKGAAESTQFVPKKHDQDAKIEGTNKYKKIRLKFKLEFIEKILSPKRRQCIYGRAKSVQEKSQSKNNRKIGCNRSKQTFVAIWPEDISFAAKYVY